MTVEREPAGITYDRLRLDRTLTQLVRERSVRTVLEIPTDGAKAMPGIYSLALARAGCTVSLWNPDERGLSVWKELGLDERVRVVRGDDPAATGLPGGSFDLVWNFVTAGAHPDFSALLREMARLTARDVLTVHCNGFNWGYPWHRLLHRAFRLPWNHGTTEAFFPSHVRALYRAAGLEPTGFGHFDMPWWPDPPGFRDVRLHLSGAEEQPTTEWSAPIRDIYAGAPVSQPLRLLGRIEEGPVPEPVRRIFSHLYFIRGARIL